MIEKINLKHLLAIAGIGLAINFLFLGCGKPKTIGELQTDTDRSLGTVKAEQSILGVEANRTIDTSRKLGEAVKEATARVERSQEAATTIAGSIDGIKLAVGECQRLARENAEIIAGIDQTN